MKDALKDLSTSKGKLRRAIQYDVCHEIRYVLPILEVEATVSSGDVEENISASVKQSTKKKRANRDVSVVPQRTKRQKYSDEDDVSECGDEQETPSDQEGSERLKETNDRTEGVLVLV